MQLPDERNFDVIILGGSYAGMSAALQLGRARRKVLVIDVGEPRNVTAAHSHGFLGRDGDPPALIRKKAREELDVYKTVQWHDSAVVDAQRLDEGFRVACADGREFTAARLILAYGVVDKLPDIEGLSERWGRSAFNCPYCHGYELQQGNIGALAAPEDESGDQALLLTDWGSVTLYTQMGSVVSDQVRARLAEGGVLLETSPVVRIVGGATLELDDKRRVTLDGIFLTPSSIMESPIAQQLGCELEDGGCITTDSAKQTTVTGVFACGDVARSAGSIALAVGEGALAGVATHKSLMGLLSRR